MSELRDLYQEVILDHNRKPRNFRKLGDANRGAEGYNPLCGDRLTVEIALEGERRSRDIGFQGSGCAISKASASLMTESAQGQDGDRSRGGSSSGSARMLTDATRPPTRASSASSPSSPACASSRAASSARRWPGTRCTRRWRARPSP